ncbi:MAG: class I SAM-dependent rRNA methyltransferase [Chloroflexaceae bacterium]|nr:class I SAM-dependent rRNA methyltransferase [Chloroflexaceae bacterium]
MDKSEKTGPSSGDQPGPVAEPPLREPQFVLLAPPPWDDYELLDTGDGKKFERFGRYRLIRPEAQALWPPTLPSHVWDAADAVFQPGRGDDGPGQWIQRQPLPESWLLQYDRLAFWARLTPFRHTGVFPEHGAHWSWVGRQVALAARPVRVLVLFGYTGVVTLMAARMGAQVCHVDASRPAVRWARANQEASGLLDCPIRWIVDDVVAFVHREQRRGARYDLIVMDPPVFGRGPKGQIWRLHESLPTLVASCAALLSECPLGLLVHAYATTFSSVTLSNLVQSAMSPHPGEVTAGELVLVDTAAGRPLSAALFARWSGALEG